MGQKIPENKLLETPPHRGFSGFCAQHAHQGDTLMYRVYVAGVWYSVGEYAEMLFDNSKTAHNSFINLSLYLFPIWNFVDAFGVFFDGGKDQNNGDYVWASLNYISGTQLIAATLVQIISTFSHLPMAIGPTGAALMSSGAFAICMFFSALVSTLKMASLQRELNALESNPSNAKQRAILEAEYDLQKYSALTWFTCGIAMTLMTLSAVFMPSFFVIATAAVLLYSAYTRVLLRELEHKTARIIQENTTPTHTKAPLQFDKSNPATQLELQKPAPKGTLVTNMPAPSGLYPTLLSA